MRTPRSCALLLAAALWPAAAHAQNPPARPAPAQNPAARPAAPAPAPVRQAPAPDSTAIRAARAAARAESLVARVDSLQRAVEQLEGQVQTHEQAKVGSRLGNYVQLSGMVLFNAFGTDARVNNADVPQYVESPQDSTGMPNNSLGAAVRQTRIGLTVSGVRAIGAQLSADLQADFYGGSIGGSLNPVLHIRTAVARLDWPHIGLMVGQDKPLVSPQIPVSYAATGIPEFAESGNLWAWIPQARLTLETGRSFRVGIQGAALAPQVWKDYDQLGATYLDTATTAMKSGRPFVEGRFYLDWGDGDLESQIGAGIHRGWYATAGDSMLVSAAYTVDGRVALGEHVLILGEGFFNGQALAGLGGGGVGQNWGKGGVPLRTQGGWGQLNIRPTFAWEIGGGYGTDAPNTDDLDPAANPRGKNVVMEGHVHWKPGGGLLFGAAYRRIETTYPAGTLAANHVNVFCGVVF